MKTEPSSAPFHAASDADWEALRRSRPEDDDGHAGFAHMTPAERLAWLDLAVEFVSQHRLAASARSLQRTN